MPIKILLFFYYTSRIGKKRVGIGWECTGMGSPRWLLMQAQCKWTKNFLSSEWSWEKDLFAIINNVYNKNNENKNDRKTIHTL